MSTPTSALSDVQHPPVVAIAPVVPAPVAPAPVTASPPAPVPAPAAPTRTPMTAVAQQQGPSNSPITGIAPVAPPPAPAPVAPVQVAPAPAPVPVPAPVPAAAPPVATPVFVDTNVVGAVAPVPVVAPVVQPADDSQVGNTPGDGAQAQSSSGPVSASVQAYAARHGIDLSTVNGTGSRGRITRKDVEEVVAAAAATTSPAPAAPPTVSPVAPVYPVTVAPAVPAPVAPIVPAPQTPAPVVDSPPDQAESDSAAEVLGSGRRPNEAVEVRVPFNLTDGRKFFIEASTDLTALASSALPGLSVQSAFLELSHDGAVLVSTVASTAAVSL